MTAALRVFVSSTLEELAAERPVARVEAGALWGDVPTLAINARLTAV